MKLQSKAKQMMSAGQMDRKGPAKKKIVMGAKKAGKPSMPMSSALKGPKMSQGM